MEYEENYYQLWNVEAPEKFRISFVVELFDTEDGRDHLYIGEGTKPFSTDNNSWKDWTGEKVDTILENMGFTTKSSSVTVIFTSDHSTTKTGFWIQLRAIEGNSVLRINETPCARCMYVLKNKHNTTIFDCIITIILFST